MKKETVAVAKTIEAAVEKGAAELGFTADRVSYEVLTEPKKGFLGFGEVMAKVRVIYNVEPKDIALSFVSKLIENMELDAKAELNDNGESVTINVVGEDASILIGHHGETLDQLQYLVNLAANKKENDDDERNYTKVTVDIENYRAKREEALRSLARRMAQKVIKYKKNVALEPMSAYERRIIHSEVQGIAGVTTSSVGQENNRRVIIMYEK